VPSHTFLGLLEPRISRRPLGQDLEGVLRAFPDLFQDFQEPILLDVLAVSVPHGIDEDFLGLLPRVQLFQPLKVRVREKTVAAAIPALAFREPSCVAVSADVGAADYGV